MGRQQRGKENLSRLLFTGIPMSLLKKRVLQRALRSIGVLSPMTLYSEIEVVGISDPEQVFAKLQMMFSVGSTYGCISNERIGSSLSFLCLILQRNENRFIETKNAKGFTMSDQFFTTHITR